MKEIVNDGFAKVVKPYIDAQDKKSREIIAPVEVSPAEAPHSVGDQIIYNGLLYDVIAPIAVEDPLATSGAGANISPADNIEAQIKATKSQIQAAAAQAAAQNKKTQKMLAPVEEDETDASRAYVIGEQLILDGILYNVIDPIAQHGIITAEGAGANIEEADDVTTQLSSLNQTLTNNISDINTALGNEVATRAKVSGHNLLSNEGIATSTDQGITYTKQSDGSVVANGTATNWAYYNINSRFLLEAGTYILSGKQAKSGTQIKLMNADTSADVALLADNNTEITFTLAADTNIHAMVYVGTAAGEVTDFVFKPMIRLDTDASSDYEPYSMTNQELTPIAQAVSNRNLLDNPWFTVNQRGVTSWTNYNGYTVDRWIIDSGDASISNGVLSHTGNLYQLLEDERIEPLLGKVVTASILKSDDSIESVTFTMPSSLTGEYVTYGASTSFCLLLRNGNVSQIMRINGSVAVKAVKLELGSVSTLAQDTAPNYATELLKCQRYFQRYDFTGLAALGSGHVYGSYGMVSKFLPVAMRADPTLTVNGGLSNCRLHCNGQSKVVTGISKGAVVTVGNVITLIANTASDLGLNSYICSVTLNPETDSTLSLDLSAEL